MGLTLTEIFEFRKISARTNSGKSPRQPARKPTTLDQNLSFNRYPARPNSIRERVHNKKV